ncbi:MAG: radical SAM protein [Polyangiaceae bacterium]
MSRARRPRVLLVWPGTDGAAAGNFGVPQLVTMATYVREVTGAHVEIVDLLCERAFGPVDLPRLFRGPGGDGYDIVGFSCYASYDFLKIDAVARVARATLPDAVLVTGGYHASARPSDFLTDGSPFDAVVVGEGEKPLAEIVRRFESGDRPSHAIFGSDPIEDLDSLPPSDWSFLDRYRPVLRKVASQVQVYLSRGCPFDCAFCMERAKREVSWRAYSVPRAIDEMRRLAAFADLTGMTVYIADALFGMRTSWRRAFLEALAREPIPAAKLWLLIRVDLMDDEDLRLFAAANCSPGFGLESGDPSLLGTIRKAGRLEDYLDRMRRIAARARELDVPWGANVIVGHPGETEATLRTTARYLRELFLDPKGTTGFLSVDPFRLYPGSPIDDERPAWESRFGARFHRPEWWNDGDQEFLSEWVDPSEGLDYRRRAALSHDLLAPITASIRGNFVHRGPARDYYLRAIDHQAQNDSPATRLHFIGRHYAWHRYLGKAAEGAALLRRDPEAEDLLRARRTATLRALAAERCPDPKEAAAWLETPIARALAATPRERFVPLDHVLESARDAAIPLDDTGAATVSALHAYARTFELAGVREGARVLDLGAGTGYGTALLARLVGPTGRVVAVELDRRLAARARAELPPLAVFLEGDALDTATLTRALAALAPAPLAETGTLETGTLETGTLETATLETGTLETASLAPSAPARPAFDILVCGFAVESLPPAWARVLAEGGVAVVPVGQADRQQLVRATLRGGAFEEETFGDVRYVRARRPSDLTPRPNLPAPAPDRARRTLRVL